MNPSIEAAWIAGGSGLLGVLVGVTGTVIIGVAGFRNTRDATDKSVLSVHRERVWDRKADAYQDALAAALWREHRRVYLTHTNLSEEQYAEEANTLFQRQSEQEWWALQGRLGTFGAPRVVKAYNDSLRATELAQRRHEEWRDARGDFHVSRRGQGTTPVGPDQLLQASVAALQAFEAAMDESQAADVALERAIRADLDEQVAGTQKSPE